MSRLHRALQYRAETGWEIKIRSGMGGNDLRHVGI
jgi:hypothetical protein